ncbi:MAG: rhomboid family intramembrane serine protease [Chitinophagaceae bacterium]|nr:rhomboid family intramembrane serine protease [Chitinophagaceae bacterium]
MQLSITLLIVLLTVIISFGAFNNTKMINDMIFYPPAITRNGQWYRFITCGLIHADPVHLFFNMISLYMFGEFVEEVFVSEQLFGSKGKFLFLLMYVLALVFCLLPTFYKHKHDYSYRSLGASGAVSAVVFAGIFLEPRVKIGLFFIPPVIPGYIFGPLYLILSSYLERKAEDNVNHSAHFWGAVFGIVFLWAAAALLQADCQPAREFILKVKQSLGF